MKWVLIVVTLYSAVSPKIPGRLLLRSEVTNTGFYDKQAECQAWVDGLPLAATQGRTDQRVCVPIRPQPAS
jgi:hypothetical protein